MVEDDEPLLVKQLAEAHGKWKPSLSPNGLTMIRAVNAGENAFKKLEQAVKEYGFYSLKKDEAEYAVEGPERVMKNLVKKLELFNAIERGKRVSRKCF